ncbi:MAG: WD40/YVTN/BNR-like repeat-containing protein [Aeromicrobium sp.]
MSSPVRALLIGTFLLLDAALGFAAWRHLHHAPPASDVAEARVDAAQDTSVGVPGSPAFAFAKSDAVLLDASASGMLVAARRGDCHGPAPTISVSADAGKTVSIVKPDIREVLAVKADDDGSVTIVGGDAKCRIIAVRSTDDGRNWDNVAVRGWYAGLKQQSDVGSPKGIANAGCAVTALSSVDSNFARLACADGRIRGTGDAGRRWATLGRLENLRAVTFDDYSNGVALARYEGCGAFAFATADGGRTWKQLACAGSGSGRAIASDGSRLIAVVDNRLAVSSDGGRAWKLGDVDLSPAG